ncbi:hypothetical protein MNV49_000287 [Pseudohyphozyma bogoriensis]|nr:hypothetical protein MNV49_000287 [Pseudohyphozyma bogoriensis]
MEMATEDQDDAAACHDFDVPDDPAPFLDEVAQKVLDSRSLRSRLHRTTSSSSGTSSTNNNDDSQKRNRMMDFVLGVSSKNKENDNDREVGDDFFAVQTSDSHRSFVNVSIAGATHRVKKIGRYVGDVGGTVRRGGRAKKGTAPLVVVHEEEHGEPQATVIQEEEQDPSALVSGATPSPAYSVQSFAESPEGSEASFDGSETATTVDESSRPGTPSSTAIGNFNLSIPSMVPLRHVQSASTVTSNSSFEPSRTLTLDESLPKARRRDSRSDFTPKRKITSRAKDFQKILDRRRRKIMKQGVDIAEVDNTDLDDALLAVIAGSEEKEQYEWDLLWENQRGLIVFGNPRFSSAALAQFDRAAWTTADHLPSPYTPHDHPLPTPFWKWDHSTWLVDMSGDVDESGWRYAIRFQSKYWRGEAETYRSFVRRRRWIRGRYFTPQTLPTGTTPEPREVDWDSIKNDEWAKLTPDDGLPFDKIPVSGSKAATSLLPLSAERKDDVFGWETALDAQDPFLAWSFVKYEGERVLSQRKDQDPEGSRSDEELLGVWRGSVVEINYRRVARVLGACRLDREKLALWRWWLGLDVESRETEVEEDEDTSDSDTARTLDGEAGQGLRPGAARRVTYDAMEGRLDRILQLFEFQLTRLYFLRLVLSLHPVAHVHHRYQSWDVSLEPAALSPKLIGSRLGARLDFYGDVSELMKSYEGKVGATEIVVEGPKEGRTRVESLKMNGGGSGRKEKGKARA